MDIQLSVVIPCYNEEGVLFELRRRLLPICEAEARGPFEIILVDDGSQDRTREIIRDFQAKDGRFVGVLLSRNHGHQLALTAGLALARGQRIFIIDADLQDPPELLSEMMKEMNRGFDVVYGQRLTRSGESAFKKFSASAFYRILNSLTEIKIPLDTGDFRLMSRRALEVVNNMPEQHRFIRGMVSWVGFKQTSVKFHREERFAGQTKYPLRKMVRFALDAITSFSVTPLRLASLVGVACAGLAIFVSIGVLISWVAGATVQGWASTMIMMLFMSGVQLIMIGLLGEYVGRMYIQSKQRPLFIIEEIIRNDESYDPNAQQLRADEHIDFERTE